MAMDTAARYHVRVGAAAILAQRGGLAEKEKPFSAGNLKLPSGDEGMDRESDGSGGRLSPMPSPGGADRGMDRLAPPPRTVPSAVRWRIVGESFGIAGAIMVGIAIVLGVIGTIFLVTGGGGTWRSSDSARLVGGLVLLGGLGFGIALVVHLRMVCQPLWQLLERGEPVEGQIIEVFDRTTSEYRPYSRMVDEWSEFQSSGFAASLLGGLLESQLKDWPIRIRPEGQGKGGEIDARLNMAPRLNRLERNPKFTLLADPNREPLSGLDLDEVPWLQVSARGEWMYHAQQDAKQRGWLRSLGHALLVVVPTYCLAAWGASRGGGPWFPAEGGPSIPPLLGAFVVLLFTLSHGVFPVFFYRIFAGASQAMRKSLGAFNPAALAFGGFTMLHMGFWYGAPMIALAGMTGWYSLAWITLHIIFARPGWRQWVFLEYGSTAMALMLFLILFAGVPLFPVGIIVVVFQACFLTLVEWKGRPLWTGTADSAAQPPG